MTPPNNSQDEIEFRLKMAGIDEPPIQAINSMQDLIQKSVDDAVREARADENRIAYREVSKKYRGFGTRSDYQSVKYKAEGVGIMLKTGQAQKLLDNRLDQLKAKKEGE